MLIFYLFPSSNSFSSVRSSSTTDKMKETMEGGKDSLLGKKKIHWNNTLEKKSRTTSLIRDFGQVFKTPWSSFRWVKPCGVTQAQGHKPPPAAWGAWCPWAHLWSKTSWLTAAGCFLWWWESFSGSSFFTFHGLSFFFNSEFFWINVQGCFLSCY